MIVTMLGGQWEIRSWKTGKVPFKMPLVYKSQTAASIQNANITNVSIADKTSWENLDSIVRDVVIDLVYQGFTQGPKPMIYGMLNDREIYAHYIESTSALSQYEPGRKRVNYLRGNI